MTRDGRDDDARRHQDLMLRIARKPGFCCCCICLPVEDRRRARRIFRLTRKVVGAWDKERVERMKAEAEEKTGMP